MSDCSKCAASTNPLRPTFPVLEGPAGEVRETGMGQTGHPVRSNSEGASEGEDQDHEASDEGAIIRSRLTPKGPTHRSRVAAAQIDPLSLQNVVSVLCCRGY